MLDIDLVLKSIDWFQRKMEFLVEWKGGVNFFSCLFGTFLKLLKDFLEFSKYHQKEFLQIQKAFDER